MINTQKGKNEKVSQFPVEPPPLKPSEKSSNLKSKHTNENLKRVSDFGDNNLPIDFFE